MRKSSMTPEEIQRNSETATTDARIPTSSDEHSLTVGPDRPILLQDYYLIWQRNTVIRSSDV
jgi:catalase